MPGTGLNAQVVRLTPQDPGMNMKRPYFPAQVGFRIGTGQNAISLIYKALGQLDQALEYQVNAVAILQTNFPNGHPNLDTAKKNLELLKLKMMKK